MFSAQKPTFEHISGMDSLSRRFLTFLTCRREIASNRHYIKKSPYPRRSALCIAARAPGRLFLLQRAWLWLSIDFSKRANPPPPRPVGGIWPNGNARCTMHLHSGAVLLFHAKWETKWSKIPSDPSIELKMERDVSWGCTASIQLQKLAQITEGFLAVVTVIVWTVLSCIEHAFSYRFKN